MAFDDLHEELTPKGSLAIRVVPLRQEPPKGTQDPHSSSPKSSFCARVDLPTLILSDDDDEPSDPRVTAKPAVGETKGEGAENVEAVANLSSSSSSSKDKLSDSHRATETEEDTSSHLDTRNSSRSTLW